MEFLIDFRCWNIRDKAAYHYPMWLIWLRDPICFRVVWPSRV